MSFQLIPLRVNTFMSFQFTPILLITPKSFQLIPVLVNTPKSFQLIPVRLNTLISFQLMPVLLNTPKSFQLMPSCSSLLNHSNLILSWSIPPSFRQINLVETHQHAQSFQIIFCRNVHDLFRPRHPGATGQPPLPFSGSRRVTCSSATRRASTAMNVPLRCFRPAFTKGASPSHAFPFPQRL